MIYWLPVLACMSLIFYFSSQPYHKQDLRPRLHNVIPEKFIQEHLSDVEIRYSKEIVSVKHNGPAGFIEFFIRKGAHLTVYATLGLLLFRALADARWRFAYLTAVAGCCLYAGSDEFHQYLTGDRTPLAEDVLLDTFGAAVGALLYFRRRKSKLR